MNKIFKRIGVVFVLLFTILLNGCANYDRYDGVAYATLCCREKDYDDSLISQYTITITNGDMYISGFKVGSLKNGNPSARLWGASWDYKNVGEGAPISFLKLANNGMYIERPNIVNAEKLYLVKSLGSTYMLMVYYDEGFSKINAIYKVSYGR